MQYSENLDLLEPDQNEQYNIDHFNTNSEILDSHIHDLEVGMDGLTDYIDAGDAAAKQFANMTGTCQLSQGGTGKTTAQDALNELHKDVATVEGDLSPVDEMLFVRRTNENVAENIPESIDVKNVTLEVLASKIFALMDGAGRFTSTKDGFVPKSGNNGAGMFLNAQGNWAEPQGKIDVIPVTASASFDVGRSTIIRIQQNATVLIRDPSQYMSELVISNETPVFQLVSLKMKDGSVSYKVNKGRVWRLSWNGSYWVPQYYEPECGAIQQTYATVAPDGWFMCNGQDTTGTANELSTCYPNLYALLGDSNILPDWRECVPVGAGRNARDSIAAHDEYTVGQFKDDAFQTHTHTMAHTHTISHTHTRGTMEITGAFDTDGYGAGKVCLGHSGAFYPIWGAASHFLGSENSADRYGAGFQASRAWTGNTSEPTIGSSGGASNGTTSAPTGRAGASTHGKQKGVNIMIKA